MISQIGPLVQAGSALRNAPRLHLAGAMIGAAASGSFLCLAAALMYTALPDGRALGVAIAGMTLALAGAADLEVITVRGIGPSRQTPGNWTCTMGPRGASFGWGVDLGNGITTRLPYYGLIGVLIAAALAAHPWYSMLMLMTYGFARAIAVVSVLAAKVDDTAQVCTILDARSQFLRRSVGVLGVAVGLMIAATSLA